MSIDLYPDLPEKVQQQLEQHRKQRQDNFVKNNLMSDEVLDYIQANLLPFNTMMTYYRCAMMEVETKFRVLDAQFSLQYERNPIESIKTRLKSIDSIARKIRRRNVALTLQSIEENITDIAGVRVICSFPSDIYMLADCLLQQDDVTLIRKKDYIQNPKESGYRSLHLIVEIPIFLQNEKRSMKVEVQLRTIAMDFWATIEHKLQYKKDVPPEEAEYLSKELFDCARASAELDARMQAVNDRMQAVNADKQEKSDKVHPVLLIPGLHFNNLL